MGDESQQTVILQWQAERDESAFRILYESLFHSMLVLAGRYVGTEAARDIVQDIFLTIWNSPEKYSHVNDLRFYLYRIVRNRCLNHIRDFKPAFRLDNITFDMASEDFFYHVVLEEEVFLKLRDEIAKLPGIYRDVLLFTLEGKSDKEAAKELNISVDNVKVRKKRGKEILKKTLKNPVIILLVNLL